MIIKLECPECRKDSIDFYTGICKECEYTLKKTPQEIAKQHVENIVVSYQLQKLSLKEKDIIVITPNKSMTREEAKRLFEIFDSASEESFSIILLNEKMKIENVNDDQLKEAGLIRIKKNEDS